MILNVSFSKFKSINEEQTLSFIADKKKEFENSLLEYDKYKILPAICITGKNASGKTNVLNALLNIRNQIKDSHNYTPNSPIPLYEPFLFCKDFSVPSKFEITLVVNEVRYTYGFSHNRAVFLEEYLYVFNSSKPSKIFERKVKEGSVEYEFGKEYKAKLDYLVERTHNNKLFLSVAAQWVANFKEINDIYNYFVNKIEVYSQNDPNNGDKTAELLSEDPEARAFLRKMLIYFDLEISDIAVDKISVPLDKLPPEILKAISNFKNSQPADAKIEFGSEAHTFNINSIYNINGKSYHLDFNLESTGTKNIYKLFAPIYTALKEGKILLIDEIETGLHSSLASRIIKIFQDSDLNTNNSQILFTTHDTNLLDLKLFRRDQIWFTEKRLENNYSTEMYSLADIRNVRITDNIAKGYLEGRYTTIPLVRGVELLENE